LSVPPEVSAPAPRRSRSIRARKAARLKKINREKRIVAMLNAGISTAEIASRERLTLKRMRTLVQEILARRMPQPPAEFLAVQVSRLNEALLVSYGAMSNANLEAVDRVVKIVRELDRYHGFNALHVRRPEAERLAAPPQAPLALEAAAAAWLGDGAAID
jgi:DNA-binding CsgD family transcriptional regulator